MRSISGKLAGRRIAVIDDEIDQATGLVALLALEGISAVAEHVAPRALARLVAEPPDALVLDVKMPGMSGTELFTLLRERYPELPAVFLTGYEARDPHVEAALTSSRVAHLTKPVHLPDLIEKLVEVLEGHRPYGTCVRA
ncbi:MAG TPA: response regulator [Kofleriaceae bacterium]|nr:response regulator [Kofleriaceae bacterium]